MEKGPYEPRKRPPAGADPGTLALDRSRPGRMRLLRFGAGGCELLEDASVGDCARMIEGPGTVWIELASPDRTQLEGLRDLLKLHPLAVADVAHPHQKPRFSAYVGFDLLLAEAWAGGGLHQVALFAGDRWVLSVAETEADLFEAVRERLAHGLGAIRGRSPAFLVTALLATLVDGYFEPIEKEREEIERLEDRILTRREAPHFERLHRMRGSMLQLRRAIEPLLRYERSAQHAGAGVALRLSLRLVCDRRLGAGDVALFPAAGLARKAGAVGHIGLRRRGAARGAAAPAGAGRSCVGGGCCAPQGRRMNGAAGQ